MSSNTMPSTSTKGKGKGRGGRFPYACTNFQRNGVCRFGDNCRFQHVQGGGEPAAGARVAAPPVRPPTVEAGSSPPPGGRGPPSVCELAKQNRVAVTGLTEKQAENELKRIPAADRRAAVGDLKMRGVKWMGPELPNWNARLAAVRRFLADADAAGVAPQELAKQRAVERGDPEKKGGCAVM